MINDQGFEFMDNIIVTIGGFFVILFIWWFFFAKKEEGTLVGEEGINVKVSGGYNPSTIVLQKGKKTPLTFIRTDPSSCLEEIVIPDFKIKKFLPLHEPVTIEIQPNQSGTFHFSCGMNMFHGRLVVND